MENLSQQQREFIEFVLGQYINKGTGELDEAKLPHLLNLKYSTVQDAQAELGNVEAIRNLFFKFQKDLYLN